MRLSLLVCFVLLAGCERHTITLDASRWVCVKTDKVKGLQPMPTGKTVMMLPVTRTKCVAYIRTDRED